MSTNITLRKYEVTDFISVDYGETSITLTFFQGKIQVGTPGWANECEMTPDQAEAVGKVLIRQAEIVRITYTKGGTF